MTVGNQDGSSVNSDSVTNDSQGNAPDGIQNQDNQAKLFMNKYTGDQFEEEFRKKEQQVTDFGERVKKTKDLSKSLLSALAKKDMDKVGELYEQDKEYVNDALNTAWGQTYDDYIEDKKYADIKESNPEKYQFMKELEEVKKERAAFQGMVESQRKKQFLNENPQISEDALNESLAMINTSIEPEQRMQAAYQLAVGLGKVDSSKVEENFILQQGGKLNASVTSMNNLSGNKVDPAIKLSKQEAIQAEKYGIPPELMVRNRG